MKNFFDTVDEERIYMNDHHPFQKQVEAFNQRLVDMADHQRQAFTLLFADRMRRELDVHADRPTSSSTLLNRLGRWLAHHIVTSLKQYKTRSAIAQAAADQIIDGDYRVLDLATDKSDSASTAKEREQ